LSMFGPGMPVVLLEKKYPKCNANVTSRPHEMRTVVPKRDRAQRLQS
jgi:hypothetical protein